MVLYKDSEIFVVHVIAVKVLIVRITIHFLQEPPIVALQQDKALIKILSKYSDFADIFSFKLAIELPKNLSINKQTIEQEKVKQPFYR